MTTYVGIDPDSKATGICVAEAQNKHSFYVIRASGRLAVDRMFEMAKMIRRFFQGGEPDGLYGLHPKGVIVDYEIAIEWQQHRPGREKDPNSIFPVQAVAGMALASAIPWASQMYIPVPSAWRGTIEKEVEQRRILAEAGLTLDSPEFAHIPRSMRTHCVDALGLVQWMRRGRRLRGEAARA